MTAHTPHIPALASDYPPSAPAALSAEDLISGPCALPIAPMAMPVQVIEHRQGVLRRLLASLYPQAAPAPGPGH
ncbi:hypothetical protein CKO11_00970 [Rhodobacter sp. TJ_12]|uniref:hypothetical protein n=1 Tax=Rhodobacter sp. TJ_12 TaxID=2029399 RepID=UPI001CBE2ECD|nr:hypothetical protein [Rhodobacter sp. TJ_12]MBZ4021033.1 hypothetical protein [Rhodobacter sp. TJ_12]